MSHNRNVLVVGAGRYTGIGAAICKHLAAQGMNIAFTSCVDYDKSFINNAQYERLRKECAEHGVLCDWIDCDIRNHSSIGKVYDFAERIFGSHVDTFIYCSCYYSNDSLDNLSLETIDSNYDVNAKAPFLLCQEFYKRFKGDSGRIILMSSTQTLEPLIQNIAYGVTKSIVPGIVYTLFPILGQKNITINAINPGPTRIGYDGEIDSIPMHNLTFGRIGETEDVVNLVDFLISPKGKWITGQVINSEGGLVRNSY